MSTIGAKVQCTPDAAASVAAMRAECSIACMSQDAASPSGTGNTFLKPWITSSANNSGIFRRDCIASCCSSRVSRTLFTVSTEPT